MERSICTLSRVSPLFSFPMPLSFSPIAQHSDQLTPDSSVVEISTGILCGNMPYLRTLFHDRSKWPQSVEQPGNHSDISIHRQILTSFRGFLAHFTRGSSISRSTNGAMSEESNQALEHARYKSMPRSSERLWKPSAVEESSCA